MLDHVDEDPANGTGGGGSVGVEGGVHGADGAVEGGTTVEAEPSKPDEAGAEEDEGGVVRLVVHGVLATLGALAEDESVGEGGPAGGDVDGSSSGVVEGGEVEEPSVGVPGPACDRAVDDGAPAEAEDERGDDAATLEGASDDDLDGTGGEEEFVETEDNLGEVDTARGGGSGDVLHAEVCHVTDEGVGCAGKGKRVAPEDPLEGSTEKA